MGICIHFIVSVCPGLQGLAFSEQPLTWKMYGVRTLLCFLHVSSLSPFHYKKTRGLLLNTFREKNWLSQEHEWDLPSASFVSLCLSQCRSGGGPLQSSQKGAGTHTYPISQFFMLATKQTTYINQLLTVWCPRTGCFTLDVLFLTDRLIS